MKKKIYLVLTLCMTMALSMGCAGVETETAQQVEQQVEQQPEQQAVENFDSVCGDVAENIYTNDYFQLQYAPGDDYIFADDETISQLAQIAIESEAENSIYTEQLLKNNSALVAMAVNVDETKNLVILVIKSSIGGKNIPTPDVILSPEEAEDALRRNGLEDLSSIKEECEFLGEQSISLKTHGVQNGYDLYQQQRVYVKEEYYIQICATSYFSDETDEMFLDVSKLETVENEAKETQTEKNTAYDQNSIYKMFYGTWEFTDVVSEHSRLGGDEGYKEALGKQVTYSPEIYCSDDSIIIQPTYLMSIFPQDSDTYNPFLGYQKQINLKDLIPDAHYFVWVQVVNKSKPYEGEYLGTEFFLKDDNTMYAFDYNCIFELKRVGYIEDTTNTESILEGEKTPREREYRRYRQTDAYKLFYGTWKFTSVVLKQNSLDEDKESEELIGTRVTYLPKKYECNENYINYPNYMIAIIPQSADSNNPNFEDWMQFDMKELIPDELYYIGVQIVNKPEDSEDVYRGTRFFLKDDNTMYALEDDCIYELKRVEYIEGYDPYDIISYQERW